MMFPYEIGNDFGAHGKAAQESQQDGITSFVRDSKYSFQQGRIDGA